MESIAQLSGNIWLSAAVVLVLPALVRFDRRLSWYSAVLALAMVLAAATSFVGLGFEAQFGVAAVAAIAVLLWSGLLQAGDSESEMPAREPRGAESSPAAQLRTALARLDDQLAMERAAATELWTRLPSYMAAKAAHGEEAASHEPALHEVLREAALCLDGRSKACSDQANRIGGAAASTQRTPKPAA